jgi:hypothetical protein
MVILDPIDDSIATHTDPHHTGRLPDQTLRTGRSRVGSECGHRTRDSPRGAAIQLAKLTNSRSRPLDAIVH